jgi:hypothetical protein
VTPRASSPFGDVADDEGRGHNQKLPPLAMACELAGAIQIGAGCLRAVRRRNSRRSRCLQETSGSGKSLTREWRPTLVRTGGSTMKAEAQNAEG